MPESRPYRPSNGSEGDWFQSKFCEQCRNDSEESPCGILARAMLFDVGESEYPREWVQDDSGPRCTAFRDVRLPDDVVPVRPLPGQMSLFDGA